MSFAHDEEGGYRQRHMSVSNYAANVDAGPEAYTQGRRRSSIVPAGSVSAPGAATNENVFNQKDDTLRKMSVAVPNLAELTADAKVAADMERKMTFREGFRLYPKAIIFSFCISLAVVMEGYDTWLIGTFYSIPVFNKKYGGPAGVVDGVQTYQIGASWQSALSNGGQVGSMIGLMANGIISERIGYRKTMSSASSSSTFSPRTSRCCLLDMFSAAFRGVSSRPSLPRMLLKLRQSPYELTLPLTSTCAGSSDN